MDVSSTRLALTAGTLALAASLVAGCSSSTRSPWRGKSDLVKGGSVTSEQVVVIHGTDQLRFAPDVVTVHPGTVMVKLMDDGSYPHDFAVPSLHVKSATVTGNPGGTSTVFVLRLTHKGTYRFVCTYHASAGMRGELVVK